MKATVRLISEEHFSHRVGTRRIQTFSTHLNAANYRGCKSGIVLSAKHRSVHQDKSAREGMVPYEQNPVTPDQGTGEATAPHSRTLDGKIPWTEEPGGLQSRGSRRVGRSDFTFPFHFHALEKEKATHSSVLAWRIPGMAEPGGLPSMGSHRVGHD